MLQLIVPGFENIFILQPKHPEQLWRIISSIFLHANIEHLFFNCIAIFFFAPILERAVGRKEFYKIFFIGGITGSILYLLFVFLGVSPPIPALGASGAIYAVLGALAFLYPNLQIYIYFFPTKIKYAVILWVILNMFYIVDWSSGIGGAAHLGGLVFGYWYVGKYVEREIYHSN